MNLNRKVAFQSLVGSHNYNLNDETSDKDYKVFVYPTFDDLYNGKMYSHQSVGEFEDYDVHDLRKLPDLLRKANVNFLETLFSMDYKKGPANRYLTVHLFAMRDELVTMNLPYLFNSTKGMHFQKRSSMLKTTEGTRHLVEKYGYDTKDFLHAYRVLDLFDRFYKTNFEDFEYALRYSDKERVKMLEMKNGKYSYEEAVKMLDNKLAHHETYAEEMKKKEFNKEVFFKLETLVKEEVRRKLVRCMQYD